jgi:hyperosmotically inducible periplasmic protein
VLMATPCARAYIHYQGLQQTQPASCTAMRLTRSTSFFRRYTMSQRHSIAAIVTAVALLTMSGCAVTREQESVGAYIDDTAITTSVKARFIDNKDVDASSIRVETLKGTVMLSGFAKNNLERNTAETIAMKVKGVKTVKNEIAVRP